MAPALSAPVSPEALTPEWLTSVLIEGDRLSPSNAVTQVMVSALGDGLGETGTVVRIRLSFRDPQDSALPPTSAILKFQTDNGRRRAIAASLNLYGREIRFYRELASSLPIKVPTCWFAGADPDGSSVIMLEDFADYEAGDEVRGCLPEQARSAVSALGDLHGHFWKSAELDRHTWLPGPTHPHGERLIAVAAAGWDQMVKKYGDALPSQLVASKEQFFSTVSALQHWMAADNQTLVHGDFRLDNLMFGNDSSMVTLDWQLVGRSRGIQDVAYLLSHSMAPEVRRTVEESVLELYRGRLDQAGVSYSPADCMADYRRAVLYAFMAVVAITGTMKNDDPRALRRKDELVRRAASSLVENDALSLLVD